MCKLIVVATVVFSGFACHIDVVADEPQDVTFLSASAPDVEARIRSLEEQIEWLQDNQRSTVIWQQPAPVPNSDNGAFFGTELAFLRQYGSGARSSSTATGGKWLQPEYGTANRFMLGYRRPDGLGVRASYFTMHNSTKLAAVFGGGTLGLNVEAVDAEVTLRKAGTNWDAEIAGGVRYGKFAYSDDGIVFFPGTLAFEGFGPTIAAKASRKLGNSGLTIFGSVRGSLLMGEVQNDHPARGLSRGTVEDEIARVFENQLGVAWEAMETDRMTLEVRAAWETQFWLNDTMSDDVYGIGTHLALSGPSLAVELRY